MNEVLNTIARIKSLMRSRLTRAISTGGKAVDLESFHHGLNQYHAVFENVLDDLEGEIRKSLKDRKSSANDPRFVYDKHPKTAERLLEENLEIVRKDYEKLLDSTTLEIYEFGKRIGSFEARLEKHYGQGHRDSRDTRRDQATGVDFKKSEQAADSERLKRTESTRDEWIEHNGSGFPAWLMYKPDILVDVIENGGVTRRNRVPAYCVKWSQVQMWRISSDQTEPTERAWLFHGFSSRMPVDRGEFVDVVIKHADSGLEEIQLERLADLVLWDRVSRWRLSREAGEGNEDEAKDAES